MNTEVGKKILRMWRIGLYSKLDVHSAYMDYVADYMNNPCQDTLDIARDLLHILTEIIG